LVVLPPPVTNWNIGLLWGPSSSLDVVAYKLYYGTASKMYTKFIQSATNFVNFVSSDTNDYYFAVTAVNSLGIESNYSNEVTTVPPRNRIVRFFVDTAPSITGPWSYVTNVWTATNPPAMKFYRMNYSIEYFY
jgi:hypothetical protein